MSVIIEGEKIKIKMTAGAAVTKGQVVYVSGAGQVAPADETNAGKVIGVADNDAAAGQEVEVIVFGKATVVADGAINPGDRVRAAPTAGRVVAENTIPNHTHTIPNIPVTAGVTALTADLGHDNTTGALQTTATSSVGIAVPDTNPASAGEHGRIIGIALGSAAAAGDQIEIFVCKM